MAGKKSKKKNDREMLELGGRVPPQAVDVERYVLGAMLLEKEAVGIAIEVIDETAFYREAHRKIYEAIISLYRRNEAVDLITVENELEKRGELEEIGGAYYLTELVALVPSAANIEYHLKIIREKAILRKLILACTGILKEAYEEQEEAEEVLAHAQQEIFDLLRAQKQRSYANLEDILKETISEIEKKHHTEHTGVIGVPSGFHALDDITAGFQKGDLIILAGRPSMGKTAFALNLARNAALDHNVPVGFFSLEMSDMQLVQRLICAEALIDSQRLRTGRLTEKEWTRLSRYSGKLADAPMYIDDTPGLDIMRLSARARRMALEKNIGLLIIDYLQLMEAPKGFNSRQEEIAYISRSLKNLAKQLGVPIIALSQLSRAVENRPDKRPNLADLRESGAIEQDADLVMFVYREEFYLRPHKDTERLKAVENQAEIIIGKHRNGPTGVVHLSFLKQYGKFSDMPKQEEEPTFISEAPF